MALWPPGGPAGAAERPAIDAAAQTGRGETPQPGFSRPVSEEGTQFEVDRCLYVSIILRKTHNLHLSSNERICSHEKGELYLSWYFYEAALLIIVS